MSISLRERWVKQLEAAKLDPSWRAQAEVRVLQFLLARYEGNNDIAPLAPFPLYEGHSVSGRARMLLSRNDQHQRLEEIAQARKETEKAEQHPSLWQEFMVNMPTDRISESAYKSMMNRRRRRDHGFW